MRKRRAEVRDGRKEKSESDVAQSCLTLSDPRDCSPPGSSIRGIFQARALEWGAIAFSTYTVQALVNASTVSFYSSALIYSTQPLCCP